MMNRRTLALSSSSAFTFVLTMGIVNLFGDMTYEGGASINGPFLGTLGASAAAISITAVGEVPAQTAHGRSERMVSHKCCVWGAHIGSRSLAFSSPWLRPRCW
jgi:hypothetical protein